MLDDPGVDSVLVVQDAHERLAISPEHDYLEQVKTVVEVSRSAAKPILLASSASAGIHPMLRELVAGSPVPFLRGLRAGVVALRGLGITRPQEAALWRPGPPAALDELRAELRGMHRAGRLRADQTNPGGLRSARRAIGAGRRCRRGGGAGVFARVSARRQDRVAVDIPHRAEVGGVVTGIGDEPRPARGDRTDRVAGRRGGVPGARIEGYELQPQVAAASRRCSGSPRSRHWERWSWSAPGARWQS